MTYQLTTLAALPSGGGCMSSLPPEVAKPEPEKKQVIEGLKGFWMGDVWFSMEEVE